MSCHKRTIISESECGVLGHLMNSDGVKVHPGDV